MRQRQGRLQDALADARAAVAIKEKSEGPDSPDTGQSLTNVALYLAEPSTTWTRRKRTRGGPSRSRRPGWGQPTRAPPSSCSTTASC